MVMMFIVGVYFFSEKKKKFQARVAGTITHQILLSLFGAPPAHGDSLCAGVEARDEQPLDRSRLRNLSLLYPSGWPPQHAAGKTTSQSAGSCSGVAERIAGGRLSPALCCSLSPVGVSCSCSFALSYRAQLGRVGGSRSGLGSSNKIPVHSSLSLSLSLIKHSLSLRRSMDLLS